MKKNYVLLFLVFFSFLCGNCKDAYPIDSLIEYGHKTNYVNRIWPLTKDTGYREMVDKYMITDVMMRQDTLIVFTSTPKLFNNDAYNIPNRQIFLETFPDTKQEYWDDDIPNAAIITDNYGDTLVYIGSTRADVDYTLYSGVLYTNKLHTFSRDFKIGVDTHTFFKYIGLDDIVKGWDIPKKFFIIFIRDSVYQNITKLNNYTDRVGNIYVKIVNGQIYYIKFHDLKGINGLNEFPLLLL